ncbi:MAG: hypothetical protein A3J95_02520 [Candidatus Komeilibacteria bacterium RIFOXYC2_FULL_45_12]|nr:MAG: hypothetical protein A3J95_02520 [Candidatus Komeilibacteria bacterium RIFOXYC2_FULL_45_12]
MAVGAPVLQVAVKIERAVKFPAVLGEYHLQLPHNPALILRLVRRILGNVAVGVLAHRKEFKQEVAIKLMIARLRKQRHRQLRNIVNLLTNKIIKRRQRILIS